MVGSGHHRGCSAQGRRGVAALAGIPEAEAIVVGDGPAGAGAGPRRGRGADRFLGERRRRKCRFAPPPTSWSPVKSRAGQVLVEARGLRHADRDRNSAAPAGGDPGSGRIAARERARSGGGDAFLADPPTSRGRNRGAVAGSRTRRLFDHLHAGRLIRDSIYFSVLSGFRPIFGKINTVPIRAASAAEINRSRSQHAPCARRAAVIA